MAWGRSPSMTWMSVRQTAQASTRMRTSPGPGSGSGRSSGTRAAPISRRTMASIGPASREGQAILDGADAGRRPRGPLGDLALAPDIDAPVEGDLVAVHVHADRIRIPRAPSQGRED